MFEKYVDGHENLVIVEPVYVFLTAFATTSFCKHLKSIGVDYIYEKPISKEVLEQILAEIE
jgi:hypothetical protein